MSRRGRYTILLLLLATVARAHDYYILPRQFYLHQGQQLIAHLYVGDEFRKEEEKGIQRYIMRQYDWYQGNVKKDLLATSKDSTLPVMDRLVMRKGLVLLTMNRGYARISMTADKFTAYLKEEGLERILEQRKQLPVKEVERERYTRYLKTLVMVDTASGTEYRQRTGQQLEIILLQNPYLLKAGATLHAQVYFRDKPLSNGALEVIRKDSQGVVIATRHSTDHNGIVSFQPDKAGIYMIRMTHMIPADTDEADWESFWTSYTFASASQ